jgi:molybdopterin molybdotransferase
MISVAEARKIIEAQVRPLGSGEKFLLEARGMVLSHDVIATRDIPAFEQSSMDGYAFSFDGWKQHTRLQISGELAAGSAHTISVPATNAVRVFTGAPVPAGADTVVMQEKALAKDGELVIEDEQLRKGTNVRPVGSEIRQGAVALTAGTLLTPAATGFLAGIGITRVRVHQKPRVSLIVTGKELQDPGNELGPGQVYESNSYALSAALEQLNIGHIEVTRADDDLPLIKQLLETALAKSDLVLLTGGVSVGDYDFVLEAATQAGVSKGFHRIRQRPGKPVYFGTRENQLVFGLPGNPSSVLTCFYEYVLPAINLLQHRKASLAMVMAPLGNPVAKAAGLTHFLKGRYDGGKVNILGAQESYRLSSYAQANCLVVINESTTACEAGEIVEIHLLPE